ncbi:MAG: purine-nucleoside phosphorylase [Candidatus Eisenbacteria bacterium]|uniref:Purine nucleoside phosphorylase n=1 Tax=Eiseniibacteriota bacterium TaxID=2212470 RepID=A0A7Y2H339_UNCEI|nr:purine-nucleoside phosphorylase [Candidatus Eisenbacteria bacterium]
MTRFRDDDIITYDKAGIDQAVAFVRSRTSLTPSVALILGSGLGSFADTLDEATAVPYEDIPGFPISTVEGHAGQLVVGKVGDVVVSAQQGRFHPYEGYSAAQVTFPLRVMAGLGAKSVIITNAAGGVDHRLQPGDLMLIEDQVNFQFRSPLRGSGTLVDEDRFVDLAAPFTPRLIDMALKTATDRGISRIFRGTYWGNLGPTYETKAEVKMARELGGDAVGMSTVAEVIVAAHMGMETLGITCISNKAAGLSPEPLSHDEVIEVTTQVRGSFTSLLSALIPQIAAK